MSKKSYKRNQNRLYREIKRRILAEQMLIKPIEFAVCRRSVETIKIKNIVPNYMMEHVDFVKQEMANRITKKLIADGFISFNYPKCNPIESVSEIEAILNVVRPWN